MAQQVNQYFLYVGLIALRDDNSIDLVDFVDNLKSDRSLQPAKQLQQTIKAYPKQSLSKEFPDQPNGAQSVNVCLHYSGNKSLGMIVAVADTKQVRKNDILDFIQQLDVDLDDLRSKHTRTLFLDKLGRQAPLIVSEDKVKQAQREVDKTAQTMQRNLTKMNDNVDTVEEQLLPSVLDLEKEAKQAQVTANEFESEANRKRRQTLILIAVISVVLLVLAGLGLYFVFKK